MPSASLVDRLDSRYSGNPTDKAAKTAITGVIVAEDPEVTVAVANKT